MCSTESSSPNLKTHLGGDIFKCLTIKLLIFSAGKCWLSHWPVYSLTFFFDFVVYIPFLKVRLSSCRWKNIPQPISSLIKTISHQNGPHTTTFLHGLTLDWNFNLELGCWAIWHNCAFNCILKSLAHFLLIDIWSICNHRSLVLTAKILHLICALRR